MKKIDIHASDRKNAHSQRFIPTKERFWSMVIKASDEDCWEWKGSLVCGYGQFSIDGKMMRAHRVSWVIHYGEIPKNINDRFGTMYVCHHCDNRKCVNPNHLFIGDNRANLRDMVEKGRCTRSKGTKHGMSKLTEEQVINVRKLCPGITIKDMANKYNVDCATIHKILKRETWSHI